MKRMGEEDVLFESLEFVRRTKLERLLGKERKSSLDRLIARAEPAVRDHQGAAEAFDDATVLVARVQEFVREHPAELQSVHATS